MVTPDSSIGEDQKWTLDANTCSLLLDTSTKMTNLPNILQTPMVGTRTCQLELTREGDLKIYPLEDPFAFVFYLSNAFLLYLHE